MEALSFAVDDDGPTDCRADVYIVDHLDLFTRSQLKARTRRIVVNGRESKLSRRVHAGDLLEVWYEPVPELTLEPEPMELRILYEDERVIVVDKAQGVVVHPGAGNWRGTLVSGILHHCGRIGRQFPAERLRPGIVHRLDKDTSGVLVVAKDPQAHEELAAQFRVRTVHKVYYALLLGALTRARGVVDLPIGRDPRNRQRFAVTDRGGKPARTAYRVVRVDGSHSLVRFTPTTGRTHQLRVHALALGSPIVGDPIYGRADPSLPGATLMLHAYSLRIVLPGQSRERLFRAPLPDRLAAAARQLA